MSAALAVQGALVAALKVLPGLVGRVHDRVPHRAPRPYLHLRRFQEIEDGADCIDGLEIFVDLDVWSEAVGKPEASRLAGLVRRALHGAELPLAEPWALTELQHRSTEIDDDGLLVRARMSFRALVEANPAD